MEITYQFWIAILRRGALQMGLPPAKLEKGQKNHLSYKEFTNFGWSLQVAILRRGALQMGLPPAKLEKGQENHFLYEAFTNFGWSL